MEDQVFIRKTEEKDNKFYDNVSKYVKAGMIGITMLALGATSNVNAQDIVKPQTTPTYIQDYSPKMTDDLLENKKIVSQELFKQNFDNAFFENGLSGTLLIDQLKSLILNDKDNYISKENKLLFSKYISNPNDSKLYLESKNKLINIIEEHNKNSQDVLKIDNNMLNDLKNTWDNVSLINKTPNLKETNDVITNFKNKNYDKYNMIEENNYFEIEMLNIASSSLCSEKTKEIVSQYRDIESKYYENRSEMFFDANSEQSLKIEKLYQESLNLVYSSVQKDLSNSIKDRTDIYNNTGRVHSFLKDDITKLEKIKSELIKPSTKLIMDEKEEFVNMTNNINTSFKDINKDKLIKDDDKLFKKFDMVLFELNSRLSELNSIRNDSDLLKEIKDLLTLKDEITYGKNNSSEKLLDYENRMTNLIEWIDYKYANEFNPKLIEELKSSNNSKLIKEETIKTFINSDDIFDIQNTGTINNGYEHDKKEVDFQDR